MKEFLKYTLATVIGMVIFAIVIGIIGVISLMGMVASQDASTVVKEKSEKPKTEDGVVEMITCSSCKKEIPAGLMKKNLCVPQNP